MADAECKEKKKRTFRKIGKEFAFDIDKMRTPIQYSKRGTPFKGLSEETNNFHSSGYWDKRSGKKYHDSDYRGGYGNKTWRGYEGMKEDRYRNDTGRPPGTEEPSETVPVITPVILTREKDAKEISKTATPSSTVSQIKESEIKSEVPLPPTPAKQYHIASKPNVLEATVVPEQLLQSSIKLLDDSLLLGEDFSPYLLDQSNFLVVAVAGLQSCGKSTISSLLADPFKATNFTSTRSWIFRPESRDEVLSGCHSTNGVDAFITKDRVIILDLQPLLSPSVMDYIVTQERKASLDYSSSTENLLEVESLQLLTFAMSVAHVLVIVQDYVFHPNLIRLLHTCQMMKPSNSSTHNASSSSLGGNRDDISRSAYDGSDVQQYFPHLVFVHNRASPHNFLPKSVEELQSLYQISLADSNLCIESQIGICSGTFSPPLGLLSNNMNLNLFLIPDIHYQDKCSVSFEESIREMRRQLFSLSRCPLTHVTLTEKSWYQYTCRMWESIRKSSLYVEYSRLLP